MCYLYILYNVHIGKYYIGVTINIENRLRDHNTRHSKKFTRKQRGKWELKLSKKFKNKGEAMIEEKRIKSWKSSKMIAKYIEQSRH